MARDMTGLTRAIACVFVTLVLTSGASMVYGGQDHPTARSSDASHWHSSDHSRVRLIRGGMSDEGYDLVGLVIEMNEGWHTYWRSPGVLGLPPTFNWQGSENVRGVEVRWPLPQHIAFDDYETYGYEVHLVLPLEIAREDPSQAASLQLALGYAVCEEICIPTLGFVSMALPPPQAAAHHRPEFRWAIEDALSRVPTRDLEAAGIEIAPARLVHSPDAQQVLRISIMSRTPFTDPHVILEGPKGARFGQPDLRLDSTGRNLEALIAVHRDPNATAPFGPGLLLTVMGGAVAVEYPLTLVMSGDAAQAVPADD